MVAWTYFFRIFLFLGGDYGVTCFQRFYLGCLASTYTKKLSLLTLSLFCLWCRFGCAFAGRHNVSQVVCGDMICDLRSRVSKGRVKNVGMKGSGRFYVVYS